LTADRSELPDGELQVLDQLAPASNQAFLCQLPNGQKCIYKPISGERPLWDFPEGTLAFREVAAALVSDSLGWGIVPRTELMDGPFGMGMVQRWVETVRDDLMVQVVDIDSIPDGFLTVLQATDVLGNPVALVHGDEPELFKIALFDVVTNNADRKGSHILVSGEGQIHGIDHGLCFHMSDKLRTVLWGWAGQSIPQGLLDDLGSLLSDLDEGLGPRLTELLSVDEVSALRMRIGELLANRQMPHLLGGWHALPWPPL
jgi:uncharacterized repeat protein (TIGR03843 family)